MKRGPTHFRWIGWALVFGGLLGIGWIGDIAGESWLSGNYYLYEAIERGDAAAVDRLLSEGKDPSSTFNGIKDEDDYTRRESPLAVAIDRQQPEIALLLLRAGADPNVENKQGYPILHHAIEAGMTEVVKAMLESGADPNHVSRRDGGPALWIMLGGSKEPRTMKPEIRDLLVTAGAL